MHEHYARCLAMEIDGGSVAWPNDRRNPMERLLGYTAGTRRLRSTPPSGCAHSRNSQGDDGRRVVLVGALRRRTFVEMNRGPPGFLPKPKEV
jgi:hypothetical protein